MQDTALAQGLLGRLSGPLISALTATAVAVSGAFTGTPVSDDSPKAPTYPLGRDAGCMDIGMSPTAEWDRFHYSDYDKATTSSRDMGMGRVRIGVNWKEIETSPGTYSWTALDRRVASARESGLSPLLLIQTVPDWVDIPTTDQVSAEVIELAQMYGEFSGKVAHRYGDMVDEYEIWNEPNLDRFWPTPHPGQYAMFLKEAYRQIHDHDTAATVISAGLAPAANTSRTISPMSFLESLYSLGLRGFSDAIAMHPYSFPELPTGSSDWNTFRSLTDIHNLMVRYGDGHKKIWLTEFGAPTGGGGKSVRQQVQAESAVLAFQTVRSTDYLGPVFLYTLIDGGGSALSTEYHFGMFTDTGAPKAVVAAIQDAVSGCATVAPGVPDVPVPGVTGLLPAPGGGTGSLGGS